MNFTDRLIDLALEEDIGPGDLTTEAIVPEKAMGTGGVITKEGGVVAAGFFMCQRVFEKLDPEAIFFPLVEEGKRLPAGTLLFEVKGKMRALLTGERTALNFLQRLCGIATHVRNFCEELGENPVSLVDTRKTTPGWRALEKYAVRMGGARNHRMGLYDGILIKENHIAAIGGIPKAVEAVRKRASHFIRIEVEAETLDEVDQALMAGADIILLDNMDLPMIKEAVQRIGNRALTEVSGGVTRKRLQELGETGINIISAGALTHQARSVDLSMWIKPEKDTP